MVSGGKFRVYTHIEYVGGVAECDLHSTVLVMNVDTMYRMYNTCIIHVNVYECCYMNSY